MEIVRETAEMKYREEIHMTYDEAYLLIEQLKQIFSVVRLVDVSKTVTYSFDKEGKLVKQPFMCYHAWDKSRRCENCISAKAFSHKSQETKFEFLKGEVYYVISKYMEIDGKPYMLELVSVVNDKTLFEAYGKGCFIDTINDINRKMYIDLLTDAYNRNYYEDQLKDLKAGSALAIIDMDNFKQINDGYGHVAGDGALKKAVEVMKNCVRSTDTIVRYGGDEFLLLFGDIPREIFYEKLENIRAAVDAAGIEGYPQIKLSVSIGGYYKNNEDSEMDILEEADKLLYKAKITKNAVVVNL